MRENRTKFYYYEYDDALYHYYKLRSEGKSVVLKRPNETRDTYLVKIIEE